VSRKKPRKARIPGTPIVLPGSFAGTKSAQDAAAQTKQIQDLIDLLKRNHLTELEIERAGVRIRVRHEIGMKTVSATVSDTPHLRRPYDRHAPHGEVSDMSGRIASLMHGWRPPHLIFPQGSPAPAPDTRGRADQGATQASPGGVRQRRSPHPPDRPS